MENVGNMISKVLKCVRTHPEELLVVKTVFSFFWKQESIFKVLKRIRTHLEELLAVKLGLWHFFSARFHFGTIDTNERVREYDFWTSVMCQTSSWELLIVKTGLSSFLNTPECIYHHMMKMKVVKSVRAHPEELLVVKTGFWHFLKTGIHFRTISIAD